MIQALCPFLFCPQTAVPATRARRASSTILGTPQRRRRGPPTLAVLCLALLLQAVSASASYTRVDNPGATSDDRVIDTVDQNTVHSGTPAETFATAALLELAGLPQTTAANQAAPRERPLEAQRVRELHKKIVDGFTLHELVLDTLSVRWDLRDQGGYPVEDMQTLSGQYETFYQAIMGPCGRVPRDARRHLSTWVCDPAMQQELQHVSDSAHVSLTFRLYLANHSIATYLAGDQRICRDPVTRSCAKPARSREQIEAELMSLLEQQGRLD